MAGPEGAGKTTFVEALVQDTPALFLAARCIRDDSLARMQESVPEDHPELRRYNPVGFVDVFVASPPAAGQTLFVKRPRTGRTFEECLEAGIDVLCDLARTASRADRSRGS